MAYKKANIINKSSYSSFNFPVNLKKNEKKNCGVRNEENVSFFFLPVRHKESNQEIVKMRNERLPDSLMMMKRGKNR